jgi:hypothetical protein
VLSLLAAGGIVTVVPQQGLITGPSPVLCELRIMPRRMAGCFDDVTVYLVLNKHGKNGISYDETDPAEADRETSYAISWVANI